MLVPFTNNPISLLATPQELFATPQKNPQWFTSIEQPLVSSSLAYT